MRAIVFGACLCVCMFSSPVLVRAADYPSRPVHIIVGFTAGSGVDILARIVGQKLSDATGQPFIIENRPGAGSNVATRYAAAAAPDGYTLFVATVANAINATLYKKLEFDVLRDFSPVILAGTAANVLVVNPTVEARTVQELISLAKAKPGRLSFGSSGIGTSPQMAGELFRTKADISVVHVPFRGGPEATAALLGGQIDYLFAITSTALPQIDARRLRALAVTSRKRSPLLPEVPTMSESGLPGFEAVTWFGIEVPAGTPRDIIDRLNAEIGKVLATSEVGEKLAQQGIDVQGGTAEQFGVYMRDEFAKWGTVVRDSGATMAE